MDTRRIVKHVAVAADRVRRPPAGITVLIYHRVGGGTHSQVDLDPLVFRRQLELLRERHEVITLDEAVDRLASGDDAEARPAVVLTFDDGTVDFTEVAVPLLAEYELPATLYLTTHHVDTGASFPWGAPPLSWSALVDAVATGFITVGSHTHTHALLDRTTPEAVTDELERSIDAIGSHLGIPPRHFAYPKAIDGSADADRQVRRRFQSAAIAGSRVNRRGRADLHRLSRTPVQRSDGIDFFARKASGGLRLEGELRTLAAKVKYRTARS